MLVVDIEEAALVVVGRWHKLFANHNYERTLLDTDVRRQPAGPLPFFVMLLGVQAFDAMYYNQ